MVSGNDILFQKEDLEEINETDSDMVGAIWDIDIGQYDDRTPNGATLLDMAIDEEDNDKEEDDYEEEGDYVPDGANLANLIRLRNLITHSLSDKKLKKLEYYENFSLWYNPPSPILLHQRGEVSPPSYYLKKVFFWIPHLLLRGEERINCPNCSSNLHAIGFCTNPIARRIISLNDCYFLLSYRYVSKYLPADLFCIC